jgi:SAM-dependent methyltransferase
MTLLKLRPQIHDSKTHLLAGLIAARHGKPVNRLLVVGCGSGAEAAILSRELHCRVIGIDIVSNFDVAAATVVSLETGDATALRFGDGSFDFVYSYHALEHIPDFRKALSEMNRVLSDEGGYCVGTPNRARLVGYLGSKDATLSQMLAWNAADWRARLQGRFRNEFGAHAGFTSDELAAELRTAFGDVTDISLDYYRTVYARQQSLVRSIHSSGLSKLLFPSVYFMGVKKDRASH